MVEMKILGSREEWLKERSLRIGGSDASAVLGLNPYLTNLELWQIKTGQLTPEDISDKPYVRFGMEAERYIRELFKLEHPQYKVFYEENNLWVNDQYPFGHYSADGWLIDEDGRLGVWECKTTNILQSMQKEKWKERLPDNYYIQLLHGLLIMEADFAVLKARLKYEFGGEIYVQVKHYHLERAEVEEDIKILEEAERVFFRQVLEKKRPARILPPL